LPTNNYKFKRDRISLGHVLEKHDGELQDIAGLVSQQIEDVVLHEIGQLRVAAQILGGVLIVEGLEFPELPGQLVVLAPTQFQLGQDGLLSLRRHAGGV